jgi:hypothetical protein
MLPILANICSTVYNKIVIIKNIQAYKIKSKPKLVKYIISIFVLVFDQINQFVIGWNHHKYLRKDFL